MIFVFSLVNALDTQTSSNQRQLLAPTGPISMQYAFCPKYLWLRIYIVIKGAAGWNSLFNQWEESGGKIFQDEPAKIILIGQTRYIKFIVINKTLANIRRVANEFSSSKNQKATGWAQSMLFIMNIVERVKHVMTENIKRDLKWLHRALGSWFWRAARVKLSKRHSVN
jgi:hypothetical protein